MIKVLGILLSLQICGFAQRLLMIEQVFRHGARYPIFIDKADGSEFAQQEDSIGELTREGKNMHYFLGKIIYLKYWDSLFKGSVYQNQYNQSQFYVKSTDVNRTIESAQAHLFGLLEHLPPLELTLNDYAHSLPAWEGPEAKTEENETGVWDIFTTGPTFHPTPIHVQKKGSNELNEGDFLRAYDTQNCPNQLFWKQENWHRATVQQYIQNPGVQAAKKALEQAVGKSIQIQNLYMWLDTKTCLEYLGIHYLPIFDNPTHKKYFDFIETFSMYVELYSQPDQIKAVSSPFLKQTLKNLKTKANGTYTPKIVIYSAHDTTVGMILAALNMTNLECIANHYLNGVQQEDTCVYKYPIYTSSVIFELWEKNGNHSIKIIYEGVARKIPICDYKYECSLEEFQNWVNSFVVHNYNKACGIASNYKSFYVAIFILAALVVVLAFTIIYLRRKARRGGNQSTEEGYEVHMDEKISSH